MALFAPMIVFLSMNAMFDAISHPELDDIASILGKMTIGALVTFAVATPLLWRIKKKYGVVALASIIFFLLATVLIPAGM